MEKLFDPQTFRADAGIDYGERGGGKIYVFDDRTVFAVQVAQTTGRPLLLRGPAGSGKSSLAPFVANSLDQPFYPFTVTARTHARDMMWEFDALGRLNDANVSNSDEEARKRVVERHNYVSPRALWWAFDRESAARRGMAANKSLQVGPAVDPGGANRAGSAVVLIDEIDKADPDVPNNLLEALGSRRFTVHETGDEVEDRQKPLVIITTNEERELPHAFLRRCVVLHLKAKSVNELIGIAEQHYGPDDSDLYRNVAKTIEHLRREAKRLGTRPPSTAEYLDALLVCRELDVTPGKVEENNVEKNWEHLIEVALSKRRSETADTESTVAQP